MNFSNYHNGRTFHFLSKIMKIRVFLLFIALSHVCAGNLYSQQTKINLSLKNVSIEKILDLIEETGYSFLYTDKKIDVNRRIDIQANDVKEALKVMFEGTNVQYSIKGKHIVLSTKSNATETSKEKMKVTGTVIDEKGEPIIAATVIEKGTMNGTITNLDGFFSLEVSEDAILQLTNIGYLAQEINVSNQTTLAITLHEDLQLLEEFVVIGYGTAKRRDLTGSISSIKADKMETEAPREITDLMRGAAAGLNVGVSAAAKGSLTPSIRGQNTLTAGADPTLVVDGVIYYGSLSDLNTNDVESIDVLKDASSAAVYGSQAANGVIVITTKKGKGKAGGAPVITVNANVGMVCSANQMEVLDGEGFLKYRQDYNIINAGKDYLAKFPEMYTDPLKLEGLGVDPLDWYNYNQKDPVLSVTQQQLTEEWLSRLGLFAPEISNYMAGIETDWSKLVLHTGLQQDYTIGVSNNTEKVTYRWSLGYVDREGIRVGDRYTNMRTRLNLDSKITNFLTIGMNTNFAVRDESFQAVDWESMVENSPYGANTIGDPTSPYQYYIVGDNMTKNPLYARQFRDKDDKYYSLNSNLYAKIHLPLDIEYQLNFTPYLQWHHDYYHQSAESLVDKEGGTSYRTNDHKYHWTVDNILRWKGEFNKKHNIEVTLLANAEKRETWSTTANAKNYQPSDVLGYHNINAGLVPTVSSNDTYWTADALMARLFYSFKKKYMLTTSIRRDGFSAFGAKNKRASFPSVALGYVFTSEDFMQSTSNWLSYGKLRFSWGQNGNRDIGQYAALSNMKDDNTAVIDASGNPYTAVYMYVSTMSNSRMKWERTESYNLGLDFSLFNDIVSGTVDLYKGTTKDLLVHRKLPSISGFSGVTANLGELQNKGLEITVNANILKTKDVEWSATSIFSTNSRKILSLYGDMEDILDAEGNVIGQKESDDLTNEWFIGQDPNRIWSYERLGVWQLGEEEEAKVYGNKPGDFKYKDQNGDGILNSDDKVFQGYTTPRYRISLRNDFKFLKDFVFSFNLYSYLGYYGAFNTAANYNSGAPYKFSFYDMPRWTEDNPTNDYARIGSTNKGTNWVNKSFVRLDNISLSYNVPKGILQKVSVQNMRLSFAVRNVAVWSPHWNFWDPENGSISPRTFNLGVNFTL